MPFCCGGGPSGQGSSSARMRGNMARPGKKQVRQTLQAFVAELIVYSLFVIIYFFAVLHFLGQWLVQLEIQHIRTYAVVAILLIIGQAVMLEAVTTGLMRFLRRGRSE